MERSPYGQRDYYFGQMMQRLRAAIGLTQGGQAEYLGVSRRSVGDWETGKSYPKAEHLKRFIELGIQQQAFPAGHEIEEVRTLWQAAHQKVLLDERWLSALLAQQHPLFPLDMPVRVKATRTRAQTLLRSVPEPRIDWGEALSISIFYGREQELDLLTRWITQERCRVVSLLGMGGIGKSALAISAMRQMASHFEVVIFRSLRDAPSCDVLLDDCLQMFSLQPLGSVPASLERRIGLLLEQLQKVRALVVLDNLETLLEEGKVTGRFRPGFEGYGVLLQRAAEVEMQSCLLLTSREKLAKLRALEGKRSPVRSLRLDGLDAAACELLLAEKGVVGTPQDLEMLIQAYTGNPLALKMVAETIIDLFGGETSQLLSEGIMIFGNIADLLAEQFARLSDQEQTVLYWLAIAREPVTIEELVALLVVPLSRVQVLEAIDSLCRRSMIELGQRPVSFTLQSVVLEFVTERLIAEATSELQHHRLDRLIQYGLTQAHAKEYVRQTQVRLLVAPLLTSLQRLYQEHNKVETQLLSLLDQLRGQAEASQGYGPANLVALLLLQQGHLRAVDLSHLAIRGSYLQGVEMQDTSLVNAILRDTIFTEALDAVWSVAISHNGLYWAAGSRCGDIRVWREGGQTLHLNWQAHTDHTHTLSFSPDERTLATGGWDGTIKLWETQSGTLRWTDRHTDIIRKVAFSPNGCMIASGGDDEVVQIWDAASGKIVHTLAGHSDAVHSLSWSPDSSLLASGSFNNSIRVWQVQGSHPATCVKILSGHSNWVFALAFSPDGTQLVSASWDRTVKLWEVASGRLLQTLTGHTDRLYAVLWSSDGRTIASAGLDNTILLWDVVQGRYSAALHGHTAPVYSLAFTPDNSSLLSGSEDGSIRVWDVASGQCQRIIQGHAVTLYDIAWSPDGAHLASAGSDMLVILWNLASAAQSQVLRGHGWTVFGVAWSPHGQLVASSGRDNAIRLWDPTTGTCRQILQDTDSGETLFLGVAWSPNGHLLASGSYRRGIQVWDMQAHRRCWVGRLQQTRIRRVAWSPDSTRLASCGDDGRVCLWEAADGTLLRTLQGHHGGVMNVAWNPDGTRLASCGGGRGSGELLVWDTLSGECLHTFVGHVGCVFAVTWNASGEMLVSGDNEGTLRWWMVEREECVRERKGHCGTVQSLRVSPDGCVLASCGDDSMIHLWDLENGKLLQTLQRDRPYERLNITGIRGISEAQKATLRALGAFETDVDSN